MIRRKWNPTVGLAAQALLIYIWLTDLSALAGTDTYYSVYLLCGVAALLCLWDNRKGGKSHPALWVFAGLFSLAVVMGNHEIYEPASMQNRLATVPVTSSTRSPTPAPTWSAATSSSDSALTTKKVCPWRPSAFRVAQTEPVTLPIFITFFKNLLC